MTAPPAPPFLDPPAFQPPPPPPGPPVRGQLQRSRSDKVIGGVSGGLAQYSGIDALLWRVGFVALAFAGGTGVLVYLLLWLLMPAAPGAPLGYDAPREPAVPAGPRSPVPGLTVAVTLIVVGVLALLARATSWSPDPRVFVAAGLLVVGLGLIVAAFTGGRTAKGGLITLGIVLSLATVIASVAPWDDVRRDGVGDRNWAPATAAQVRESYRSGAGDVELDLSDVDVGDLDEPIRTEVEHGVGDVEVLVPEDADVQVVVNNGFGDVDLFGGADSDGGVHPGEGAGSWVGDGDPEIVLEIDNGMGDVEVSRG